PRHEPRRGDVPLYLDAKVALGNEVGELRRLVKPTGSGRQHGAAPTGQGKAELERGLDGPGPRIEEICERKGFLVFGLVLPFEPHGELGPEVGRSRIWVVEVEVSADGPGA